MVEVLCYLGHLVTYILEKTTDFVLSISATDTYQLFLQMGDANMK